MHSAFDQSLINPFTAKIYTHIIEYLQCCERSGSVLLGAMTFDGALAAINLLFARFLHWCSLNAICFPINLCSNSLIANLQCSTFVSLVTTMSSVISKPQVQDRALRPRQSHRNTRQMQVEAPVLRRRNSRPLLLLALAAVLAAPDGSGDGEFMGLHLLFASSEQLL